MFPASLAYLHSGGDICLNRKEKKEKSNPGTSNRMSGFGLTVFAVVSRSQHKSCPGQGAEISSLGGLIRVSIHSIQCYMDSSQLTGWDGHGIQRLRMAGDATTRKTFWLSHLCHSRILRLVSILEFYDSKPHSSGPKYSSSGWTIDIPRICFSCMNRSPSIHGSNALFRRSFAWTLHSFFCCLIWTLPGVPFILRS